MIVTQSRRPTIQDVARMADVSMATVSNVLSGKRVDDDGIGTRVLEATRLLQYRPNTAAANLRSGRTRMVGLVIPDFTNPFFGQVVAELERLAEQAGYRLVTVSSREDARIEQQEVIALGDWQISGLIVIPTGSDDVLWADFVERRQIPAIILDRPIARFDSVTADNYQACWQATHKLLALGHDHLLVVCSSTSISNVAERIRGIQQAITEADQLCRLEILECGSQLDQAQEKINQRLDRMPPPSAIFTLFNLGTLACIGALRGRDIQLPQALSLLGFDDYEWMQVFDPPVAAIRQPVPELATHAWNTLLQTIAGEKKEPRNHKLPCTLNLRASVGSAPARPVMGSTEAFIPQEEKP